MLFFFFIFVRTFFYYYIYYCSYLIFDPDLKPQKQIKVLPFKIYFYLKDFPIYKVIERTLDTFLSF